jgi:hypothetical protein
VENKVGFGVVDEEESLSFVSRISIGPTLEFNGLIIVKVHLHKIFLPSCLISNEVG